MLAAVNHHHAEHHLGLRPSELRVPVPSKIFVRPLGCFLTAPTSGRNRRDARPRCSLEISAPPTFQLVSLAADDYAAGSMANPTKLLTLRGAARFLGIGVKAVYRAAERGEFPVYVVDAWQRVRPEDLRTWFEQHRRPAPGEHRNEVPES